MKDGRLEMSIAELTQRCPGLDRVLAARPEFLPLIETLIRHDLAGIFATYLADASEAAVRTVLREIRGLNLCSLLRHREMMQTPERDLIRPGEATPMPVTRLEEQQARRESDVAAGFNSLGNGCWASVAFAGGTGTRFFSSIGELGKALAQPNEVLHRGKFAADAPKGAIPISPVNGLSFFELIVADALHAGIRCGRLPLVMFLTSPITHRQTVRYLSRQDLWGFPAEAWLAFQQDSAPRLDENGQLIAADRQGHLAVTGDGHGGVFRAMLRARDNEPPLIERLRREGIQHLVLHNVDNAAAHCFEPARLGYHLNERAQLTLSVVRKSDPAEPIGLVMKIKFTGKVEVVEYTVLDLSLATETDPKTGRLRFDAGHINTNLVAIDAIRTDIGPTLYAGKIIGSRIGPVRSSSVEMLNQHLTRLLESDRIRAFEVARERYFMPTKNVMGADSVTSTVTMMSRAFAKRLTDAGAAVSDSALCDLHPACGLGTNALARRGIGPGWKLRESARLYLCVRMGPKPDAPVCMGGLTMQPGSTMVIDSLRPYGKIALDRARQLRTDPGFASRLSIGRNVTVEAGVQIKACIGPGGLLVIPDGKVLKQNHELTVGPGQTVEI